MTTQAAIDEAALETARRVGYVVSPGLMSSAHLHWQDECRDRGVPYLAIFPSEPTFTVDLRDVIVDLDVVRAVYRAHGVKSECANPYRYDHAMRRRRAEPLARDLWRAITGKESAT